MIPCAVAVFASTFNGYSEQLRGHDTKQSESSNSDFEAVTTTVGSFILVNTPRSRQTEAFKQLKGNKKEGLYSEKCRRIQANCQCGQTESLGCWL